MRASLHRFLDHYGHDRQKYNETITLFWLKLVDKFLEQTDKARTAVDIYNEMVEFCGDPQLIFNYYSKELLSSEEARRGWVEPDLKPLEFTRRVRR